MGLPDAFRCGSLAAKIAGHLFDLGIDVKKLDPTCRQILYEIKPENRGSLSSHEAAAYFLGAAFSNIPKIFYLLPLSPMDFAAKATVIIKGWVEKGKIHQQIAITILNALRD